VQDAAVDRDESSGFGMTVKLVLFAAALFALLWTMIDANRFQAAGASHPAGVASSSQVTTTTAPPP
jgi:hypothetical protein